MGQEDQSTMRLIFSNLTYHPYFSMKRTASWLFLSVPFLALTGCTSIEEELASKNLECQALEPQIEANLNQDKSDAATHWSLDQVFYSKKEGKCLYMAWTLFLEERETGEGYREKIFMTLHDATTHQKLNIDQFSQEISDGPSETSRRIDEIRQRFLKEYGDGSK